MLPLEKTRDHSFSCTLNPIQYVRAHALACLYACVCVCVCVCVCACIMCVYEYVVCVSMHLCVSVYACIVYVAVNDL